MDKIRWTDITKIPNLLSLFRLVLIPVCIYTFMNPEYADWVAFVIVFVSWLTDVLDGYIARHFDMITELGKLLDPLADKLTQITLLFALCYKGYVPFYIFTVLFIKEALMLCGVIYIKGVARVGLIQANHWGKSATGCYYLAVGFLLLRFETIGTILIYLTLALAIIALFSYGKIVVDMKRAETAEHSEKQ